MTDSPVEERRKFKRLDCKGTYFWRMVLSAPVRLLDISEGGTLLASSTALPLSDAGRLRVRFGGMPFEAEVKLLRAAKVTPPGEPVTYEIGAVFASMDERSRGVMARFLRTPGGVRGE